MALLNTNNDVEVVHPAGSANPLGGDPWHKPEPTAAGAVSQVAKARVTQDAKTLAKAGLNFGGRDNLGGLAFTAGTRVLDSGDSRLQEFRAKFEDKPTTYEALEGLVKLGKEQDRQEHKGFLARDVRMSAKGPNAGKLAMFVDYNTRSNPIVHGLCSATPTALGHIGTFLDQRGLSGYLPHVADLGQRAQVLNFHAADFAKREDEAITARAKAIAEWEQQVKDAEALGKKLEGRTPAQLKPAEVVYATRKDGQGGRLAYRVASPRYTPFEVPTAAATMLEDAEVRAALKGSRAEVKYDNEKATIDIIWHADHVFDLSCGDVFKVAMRLHLDEVRSGSTTADIMAWRNHCLNLIIIGKASRETFRARHTGDFAVGRANFLGAVKSSTEVFAAFRERWNETRQEKILSAVDEARGPKDVFRGLIGAGLVDIGGRNKEEGVEALMEAYAKEPGPTTADYINAVTRFAHEADGWWTNAYQSEEVEAQAGNLVYVKNLVARVQTGLADYKERYIEVD